MNNQAQAIAGAESEDGLYLKALPREQADRRIVAPRSPVCYDAYYYAHECGPLPYMRGEPHWPRFFGRVAERIQSDLQPATVLDAGCAMGFLVEALRQRGIEAYGIDISEYAIQQVPAEIRPYCWVQSVTAPLTRQYDLVTCIEVLEHLPADAAEEAIAVFCQHADEVLFSSTPHDFKEATHVNVNTPDYWAEQFARHGFYRDLEYNAAFITPWAARFRKTHQMFSRTVRAYERRLWHLEEQMTGCRESTLEQRNELATQQTALRAAQADNEKLMQALQEIRAAHEIGVKWATDHGPKLMREIEIATARAQSLESQLADIQRSRSWRLAQKLRALRLALMPVHRFQGRLRYLSRRTVVVWRTQGTRAVLQKALRKARHRLLSAPGVVEIAPPSDYDVWMRQNEPDPTVLERQRLTVFPFQPKISVIVPTYNTPLKFLEAMIRSVLGQTYAQWELCIADGASADPRLKATLESYARAEPRILIRFLPANEGIAGNTNTALALATGAFVTFLDHDDLLAPFALYEIVRSINQCPEADFLYSDEDKIDELGRREHPQFKPDWSPDLLRSCNYITHLCVIQHDLLRKVGAFRPGFEGSQDYDLTLRVTEQARSIVHIPQVLYHWRVHPGSVAAGADAKLYAYESARKALREHLSRQNLVGAIRNGPVLGLYQVAYSLPTRPLVSIIIANRDQPEMLRRCLNSVWRTEYSHYEIVIVENGSRDPRTHNYYWDLAKQPNIRIVNYVHDFNFADAINFGVKHSQGSALLLLNNDTIIINNDWLERMLEHALRPDVGAVGAKLYFGDNRVQHGGVILNLGGVAGHFHVGFSRYDYGYHCRLIVIQNLSAVTGACLMTRREVFDKVGGFDPQFVLTFNDVDYCLKLRQQGYRIVWTPYAELYHFESATRGPDNTPEKQSRFAGEAEQFRSKWKEVLQAGDPYYSPHLTLQSPDCSLKIR